MGSAKIRHRPGLPGLGPDQLLEIHPPALAPKAGEKSRSSNRRCRRWDWRS